MKITELQAFLLSSTFPEPLHLRFSGGERVFWKQDTMLIRIRTDVGLVGYGPGPASENVAQLINRNLRSTLVNADPSKIEAIRKKILQRCPQFPGLCEAYGAVEIALLDLKGKAEGCSVSELIGGRMRDHISLYATTGVSVDPERCADEAGRMGDLGFAGCEILVGPCPDRDLELVREVRSALPVKMSLMVDASSWWCLGRPNCLDQQEVDRLVRGMSDCGLAWLQEPFDPMDRSAYRRLRENRWAPVAAGRHESSPNNLMSLTSDRIVDVVQANVIWQGGYLTCREVIEAAERACVPFVLQNSGTALDTVAIAHLGICFSESSIEWLEWPCLSDRRHFKNFSAVGQEILRHPLLIEAGRLVVPKTAGLGVDVNEGVISRHPWKPGPAWAFRSYSSAIS